MKREQHCFSRLANYFRLWFMFCAFLLQTLYYDYRTNYNSSCMTELNLTKINISLIINMNIGQLAKVAKLLIQKNGFDRKCTKCLQHFSAAPRANCLAFAHQIWPAGR